MRRGGPRALLALLVVVLAGLTGGTGVASAAPGADPAAQAAALRQQVDQLRVQAELATERYDATYAALGQAVTAQVLAQRELDRATGAAAAAGGMAGRRVRALYMAGGAPALYATVLQGGSIGDVISRMQSVQTILARDRGTAQASQAALAQQAATQRRLAALADRQLALQRQVSDQANAVQTLLARTDALLAQADAQVRAEAERQRQAALASAASRAAAVLAGALGGGLGPVAPPSAVAARVLAAARSHLGVPYLWGGTGLGGFDCSGLTQASYAAAGIALPRVAADQWRSGPQVPLSQLAPGDLLFWATDPADPSTIHHVAIYLGNGLMLNAPHTGALVRVEPVYLDGYAGAVRPGAR